MSDPINKPEKVTSTRWPSSFRPGRKASRLSVVCVQPTAIFFILIWWGALARALFLSTSCGEQDSEGMLQESPLRSSARHAPEIPRSSISRGLMTRDTSVQTGNTHWVGMLTIISQSSTLSFLAWNWMSKAREPPSFETWLSISC